MRLFLFCLQEVGSGICQLALAEDEGACDDAQDTLNDIEMHTDADIENGKSSDCDVGSVAGVNNDQSESISSNGILLSLPCPGVAAKSESDGTNRDAQCMSVSPYATSTAEETPSCDISSVEDDGNNDCRLVPNRCAICLDDYQVKDKVVWSSNVLCNHVFHYDCIMDWFVRNESNVRQRRRRHPSGRVNQQQQQVEGDGLNILAPGNNAPVLERDAIMLSTADVTRLSSSLSICFDFDLSCPCCRQSFVDPNHKPAGSRDERMIISNNNASLIEEAQSQQISKLQEESGSDNGDICDEASDLSLETAP